MSTELIKALKELEDFYGKDIPEGARPVWVKKLIHVDIRDIEAACAECTDKHRQFPTPGEFLGYVEQARARRAYNESVRDKNQAQSFFNPERHRPGIGRDCMNAVALFQNHPLHTLEGCIKHLEAYDKLQKKYPHLDWKENISFVKERMDNLERKSANEQR